MKIVLDTNILIRLANELDPLNDKVTELTKSLRKASHQLLLIPQVLVEFRAVSTRPISANGMGISSEQSNEIIDEFELIFGILADEMGIYSCWRDLVGRYQVLGKQAHDARIAACCVHHHVKHILTINEKDFVKYSELIVINPLTYIATP